MYKIRFNTGNFNSRNRRDWNNQLYNDFAVAINGKEFICKTKDEAIDRLHFIAGHSNSINTESEQNYIVLEDDRYSRQIMPLQMAGFACGYVNVEKKINNAEQKGFESIPFSSFYDLRQGNFFKGCFIDITVEA